MHHHTTMGYRKDDLPTPIAAELERRYPDMTPTARKYWWRGQSVAYLARMNARTVTALRAMRGDASLLAVLPPDNRTFSLARAASLPLPPGTVHAHVRHGDKFTEMKLMASEVYHAAAEALVVANPLALRRILFVSTENVEVLRESEKALADATSAWGKAGWAVVYSTIPRSNTGPLKQLQDIGVGRAAYTTRTHLLQLLMSLEADAWVGTRGSNWCRLYDELRCIWVHKCAQTYVEVGTDVSWKDYEW